MSTTFNTRSRRIIAFGCVLSNLLKQPPPKIPRFSGRLREVGWSVTRIEALGSLFQKKVPKHLILEDKLLHAISKLGIRVVPCCH